MRPRYIDYSLHARLNENILSAHIYNFYFVRAMIANLFVCAYLRKILHICPTRFFIALRICLYINAPAPYPSFYRAAHMSIYQHARALSVFYLFRAYV